MRDGSDRPVMPPPVTAFSFSCLTLAVATVCLYPIFPVGFSLLVFEFPSVGFCHSDFPPFASLPKCVGGGLHACVRKARRFAPAKASASESEPYRKSSAPKASAFLPAPNSSSYARHHRVITISFFSRFDSSSYTSLLLRPASTRPLTRKAAFCFVVAHDSVSCLLRSRQSPRVPV